VARVLGRSSHHISHAGAHAAVVLLGHLVRFRVRVRVRLRLRARV
jgi:hypothetical protein